MLEPAVRKSEVGALPLKVAGQLAQEGARQ